nr:hypothetical protein [Tanacetum cinerariifolium]
MDLEKSQSNPIYKITVDLLKHTNFYRAFIASSTIPSIYIQQFWDTVLYDKKVGCYRCQLDEQWFVLTKDTLREALQITPVNNNQAFVAPLSSDALINFVNEMGYPKEKEGHSDIRSTKMIIHHLQRRHRFHLRPDSPLHLPNQEPVLGYLKFSAKGEIPTITSHTYCLNSQKKMDHQYPTVAKIPVLDTGKFEQWQFQIQQYLQHEHYALWEVIEFGDSYIVPTNSDPVDLRRKDGRTVSVTTNDMQKKKNDVKARTTLLLSLPDEHQLRYTSSDHTVRTYYEKIRFFPEVVFKVKEEFVLLL